MTSKIKKVRAGAFVIATAALLAFVVVVFGGMKFWEETHEYRIELTDSVYGLERGAYVYLDGIRVGRVEDIAFGRGPTASVVITISVKASTPVHEDTRALLQFAGITGLKVIDLRGGTRTAPRLPPGSMIVAGETVLDKLEKRATELADRSTQLMERANQILDNVVTITDPKQFESLAEVMENTRQVTENLARTTKTVDAMLAENRASVKASLGAVATLVRGADGFLARLDKLITANEGPLRSAVFDLRQASRNFKELSRDVRQRPSRLLYSSPPSERKLP